MATTIFERWRNTPADLRGPVEAMLGPMQEATMFDVPDSEAVSYACVDAVSCAQVYPMLASMLKERGLERAFEIDMAIVPAIARMMRNGMLIDKERFHALSENLTILCDGLKSEISKLAGEDLNPDSEDQLAEVLFSRLRVQQGTHIKLKRTPVTGRYAVNNDVLEALKHKHPLLPKLLEYREYSKLKDSFADVLPGLADANGRIHTTFRITRTNTSRLSSASPNLQQIPTRSEVAAEVRACFVAPPGCKLMSVDECFAEGTEVDTPYGPKAIESLQRGDLVFSHGTDRPTCTKVVRVVCSGLQECVEVGLDNGKSFVATPNHEIAVLIDSKKGKWEKRRIDSLVSGTRLLSLKRVGCHGRTNLYSFNALRYAREHTVVALAALGECPSGWEVHHIDHNSSNNVPSNLRYLPAREHRSYHLAWSNTHRSVEQRKAAAAKMLLSRRSYEGEGNPRFGFKSALDTTCRHCGKVFYQPRCRRAVYCSHECRVEYKRGEPKSCLYCKSTFFAGSKHKVSAKYCSRSCYEKALTNGLNLKITYIRSVGARTVWDITVEEESHVFALACGPIVSNCGIEMRVVAHVANDPVMINIFHQDGRAGDVHYQTAAKIFGKRLEDVDDKKERYPCKTVGFGVLYGQTAQGLSETLCGMGLTTYTVDRCEALIQEWFKVYREIESWVKSTHHFALQHGYVVNMHGRRINVGQAQSTIPRLREEGLRMAQNAPIQSAASDILKLAMAKSWEVCKRWAAAGRVLEPLLTVHDEIIFELNEGDEAQAEADIRPCFEQCTKLRVPLKCSVGFGHRWSELK